MTLNSDILIWIGYNHSSGHANDDIIDKSLLGLNLDEDNLVLRLVYKGNRKFRFGFTLLPLVHADPQRQWFSSNRFIEFFPAEQKVDRAALICDCLSQPCYRDLLIEPRLQARRLQAESYRADHPAFWLL